MNNPSRILEFVRNFHMITLEKYGLPIEKELDDLMFLMLYKSLLLQELEAVDDIMNNKDSNMINKAVRLLKG